ncbi:MAG: DUF167 family protein [Thalassolituus sp.]|jgi:uncharacterized protein (TIGR00251 family)|uniref:DUF167 family protein n=1 Tax=Thalassolituus TaxID=187492 RepID=UPI00042DD5C6|nr:DUF167 family protein [Thalassolituus oleivorans]AHK16991.1 hypothetical protein R615_16510 [Thalassolituus oleivorans R6-15]MBQ0727877.1 YggU family protein [Thalassolituus oleivorans]MBQ0779256.1 YggU family protein [Thalassolituus oleivorans]MCA6126803.1 hypothetical protein [Thalassolituus oleivorans 4BN06-13]MDF1640773.1 DUF167 family protein [Thalassolituus oleivorans]|tara:strand:- start:26 stop:337 length:312 start_codon:yes stop_codon:yes gene_type:complete
MSLFYQWQAEDLVLTCHLQPKASKDEFAGEHGEAIKIRIKAAPIEGKANAALIAFLAKQFGVSKRDVEVISGELNRHKRVRVSQPKKIPEALAAVLLMNENPL